MSQTEAPGLRERKKIATRETLSAVALHLAAERGLDAVTVEQIADAADVSPRTFFNYFACKEDAVVRPDPDRPARLAAALLARPAHETPLEALRAVLTEAVGELAGRREEGRLRMRVMQDHPALLARQMTGLAEVEGVLADAVARRTGTDVGTDLYPRLVATTATSVMRAVLHRWRSDTHAPELPTLVAESFDHLARGLTPPVPHPETA